VRRGLQLFSDVLRVSRARSYAAARRIGPACATSAHVPGIDGTLERTSSSFRLRASRTLPRRLRIARNRCCTRGCGRLRCRVGLPARKGTAPPFWASLASSVPDLPAHVFLLLWWKREQFWEQNKWHSSEIVHAYCGRPIWQRHPVNEPDVNRAVAATKDRLRYQGSLKRTPSSGANPKEMGSRTSGA